MSIVARRVLVSGTVTGVGFRYSTLREARYYPGLRGNVHNATTRQVECVLQGDASDVEAMVRWLRLGPPSAQVVEVEVVNIPVDGTRGPFRIA